MLRARPHARAFNRITHTFVDEADHEQRHTDTEQRYERSNNIDCDIAEDNRSRTPQAAAVRCPCCRTAGNEICAAADRRHLGGDPRCR